MWLAEWMDIYKRLGSRWATRNEYLLETKTRGNTNNNEDKITAKVFQVTIPAATLDGFPLGLSLIGPRGSDRELVRLAVEIAKSIGLP